MESDDEGQGTRAKRLSQLADLHGQGVLSDEEFEAAAARLEQRAPSSPPGPDQSKGADTDATPPGNGSMDAPPGRRRLGANRTSRWTIAVGVAVVIAAGAATWIAGRRATSDGVHVTLTQELAHGASCGVPDEDWGWLTFTTQEGVRIEAVMEDANVVSESPCWIAQHFRVPLKVGEFYQLNLEFAGPPGTVDEGSVFYVSPLTQIEPDDYSDGHVDIAVGSEGVTIS